MDKLNVLIVSRLNLDRDFLQRVSALDPRISVKDGTAQFVADLRKKGVKGTFVDRLEKEVIAESGRQALETPEDLDSLLAEAEVIFGTLMLPQDLSSRSHNLKWVHIGGVGLDRFQDNTDILKGNITITNSSGAFSIAMAEHVLAFMFMLSKNAQRLINNQQKRVWERFEALELRDRTVGLIGLGAVGSEVARLAKGTGMKVIATRKSATRRESGVSGVDEMYPPSDLLKVLSESDYVVIALPLLPETKKLIGEKELRAMKPTAYLINVARGQIVDQPVLVKALKEGWIAGAGIDAFETEPLDPGSELWGLPNAILSPHMSGWTDRRSGRVIELFCENLKRYLAGEQLLNTIDVKRGY